MIKLNNYSKYISDYEIQSVLGLLHKDYSNLECEITIFNSLMQFIVKTLIKHKGIPLETTKQVYKNECIGSYYTYLDEVMLFPFILDKLEYGKNSIKLHTINALLHELRHHYQKTNMNYVKKGYVDHAEKGYYAKKPERDAFKFATRMMNKYKNEINKICNINIDWEFNYYYIEVLKTKFKTKGD